MGASGCQIVSWNRNLCAQRLLTCYNTAVCHHQLTDAPTPEPRTVHGHCDIQSVSMAAYLASYRTCSRHKDKGGIAQASLQSINPRPAREELPDPLETVLRQIAATYYV